MPPKRKAGSDLKGTAKKGRSSAASTPAPSTPATVINSDDDYSDDEPTEGVQKLLNKVDQYAHAMGDLNLDSLVVTRPRGKQHHDMVTSLFTRRGKSNDYSYLTLKPDHETRPLYIDPRRAVVLLESFHPLAKQAQDFLITIAEPKSRPQFIHEYKITQHSLYAAVSVGLRPDDIINTLDRFLKTPIPDEVLTFIRKFTDRFGKVKLVLKNAQYFIESTDIKILQALLKNPDIAKHRIQGGITTGKAQTAGGIVIPGTQNAAGVKQASLNQPAANNNEGEQPPPQDEAPMPNVTDEDDEEDEETVFSFQVPDLAVENVLSACLVMGYPVLEEYDFRKDDVNANLDIDLRPNTQIRYYQEKSLSKMFGNGRAKSGIIVLPCGAGKTLVGITAACTIKKGVIVLCTGSMSAVQWRQEFLKWSNIKPEDITLFTSDSKNRFAGNTGIIVTTYSMITQSRERAHDAKKMMDFLGSREWGLMLLDEVHVVPANTFRTVISCIKTHSKLGLTATLLREDDKIAELNFLIGPKLYEANWMELSQQGHIARVQCAEVWCPMSPEFYEEYLASRGNIRKQQHLYAMNPNKFQACQYLIHYHEKRGDKLIVFSDDVVALKKYAMGLGKPFICGETPQSERMLVLENFQHNPEINTLFLSKVGDTSLDLPEATCLIQISSQYGSRRQEAQRLGRILRAKRRNDVGFNAFFYSLVSKDTDEVFYSSKRQAFLVDQGYAFKVITELQNLRSTPGLQFSTAAERRELLQECILKTSAADFNSVEKTDDLFHTTRRKRGGAKPAVRRTAGGLFELSGGQDMAYSEQNRGKVALKKKKPESSAFFKKMDREKERRKAILAEEDIPKPTYGQPKGKGRGRY